MNCFFLKDDFRLGVRFGSHLLLFGGVISLLVSCQPGTSSASKDMTDRFAQQIIAHCSEVKQYQKVITDLSQSPPFTEDTLYQGMPRIRIGEGAVDDSLQWLLIQDLSYAIDSYYGDPKVAERYATQHIGDTLVATLKPEADQKTPLKQQKILWQADSLITYIGSTLRKKTILYQFEVDIKIQFDPTGRYTTHTLLLKNVVPFSKKPFFTRIMGKAFY